MESEIRGRQQVREDGTIVRPDFTIADDPQTRKSAKSLSMVEEREATLSGDIAYLGGPTKRNGVVIPLTCIFEGDLADRLLDSDLHPEYRPVRAKMVEEFPEGFEDAILAPADDSDTDQVRLWRRYQELRIADFASGSNSATEFYQENRSAMDDGFRVSWEERFSDNEISAIQSAMNLLFKDEASFYAEGQNDPARGSGEATVRRVTIEDVLKRANGIPRRIVSDQADCLTAFVDISEACLWWVVCAWRKSDFSGWVVDFGTAPEQKVDYYTSGRLRKTLQKHNPGQLFEVVLSNALDKTTKRLALDRTWVSEDDREMTIDGLGIDSGWGEYANDVYRFCRRSELRSILHATKGVGVTATDKPLVDPEAKRKKFESVHGQYKTTRTKLGTPLLQYDTNFWKTKISNFLRVTPGNPGSLTVCQEVRSKLRVIAEQLTAERATRVETKKRSIDQWKLIPGRDNHFLDCVVGCAVLAHRNGAKLPAQKATRTRTRASGKTEGRRKQRAEAVEKNKKRRRGSRRGVNVSF